MTDFNEFRIQTIGARCKGNRKAKVRNSYGVYDAYRNIRRNKWYDIGRPLKEKEFYSIIRGVNNLLADELSKGNSIVFPDKMGKLELRKQEVGASIVNGKLKVTYPIDWGETLKLWFEDKEARKDKTLLRQNVKNTYKVKYCKYDATYENKSFYEFTLNRFIKKALKEKINNGLTDTLW